MVSSFALSHGFSDDPLLLGTRHKAASAEHDRFELFLADELEHRRLANADGTAEIVNAVQISYTAGYGADTAVPAGIKAWMLMRIGSLYENREEFVTGRGIVVAELPFLDGLLDPYRILRV